MFQFCEMGNRGLDEIAGAAREYDWRPCQQLTNNPPCCSP